jgi:hypothetical protein
MRKGGRFTTAAVLAGAMIGCEQPKETPAVSNLLRKAAEAALQQELEAGVYQTSN